MGSRQTEQLSLRSQQRIVATVEESVLKTEMADLESQDIFLHVYGRSDPSDCGEASSGLWLSEVWDRHTGRTMCAVVVTKTSSIVMYNLGGGPRFAYVSASSRHQNNKLLW